MCTACVSRNQNCINTHYVYFNWNKAVIILKTVMVLRTQLESKYWRMFCLRLV